MTKRTWQKALFKSANRICWVPVQSPEHDEYYETSEGDWVRRDLLELLPAFSDVTSGEGRYP